MLITKHSLIQLLQTTEMKLAKIFIFSLFALGSVTSVPTTPTLANDEGEGLVDDATWRIHSKSADHVTYVRREGALSDLLLPKDCNKTEEEGSSLTTQSPPRVSPSTLIQGSSVNSRGWGRGRGSASASNSWRSSLTSDQQTEQSTLVGASSQSSQAGRGGAENLQLRSASGGRTSSRSGHSGQQAYENEGDHLWKVTHRTDDHITYTRRNATSSSQGQGQSLTSNSNTRAIPQGQLTQIGAGQDSVLARVVVTGDEELTEESLLASQSSKGRVGSHPTNELVHPYVKKVGSSSGVEGGSGGRSLHRRTQVRSGGGRASGRVRSRAHPPIIARTEEITSSPLDDHPPRVGDEINGWRVMSKTKDSISWQRIDSISSSNTNSVGGGGSELSLRSLDTSSSAGSGRSVGEGRGGRGGSRSQLRSRISESTSSSSLQLIPSAEGDLVEGFPRVFNTFSKSLFSNASDFIQNVASIRTTLSNTKNWKVGDELAGWKVLSIDDEGLVWQKISDSRDSREGKSLKSGGSSSTGQQNILAEEDLLGLGGVGGGANLIGEEEDSESNSVKGPLGTWYLEKETKNSATWRRDGVPAHVTFDMEQYPRVGDTDANGQWKVESKSKEHITWTRINALAESQEQ